MINNLRRRRKPYSKQRHGSYGVPKTHGLGTHRLYKTWYNMVQRCHNSKSKAFQWYGALGINVCTEWLDVSTFITDMYPTFVEGLTLDRKDVTKDYSKDNCRWVDANTQSQNTRLIYKDNTSGYRGVGFDKHAGKWRVRINVNSSNVSLGCFTDKHEAALAYNNYIIENNLAHPLNIINKQNRNTK